MVFFRKEKKKNLCEKLFTFFSHLKSSQLLLLLSRVPSPLLVSKRLMLLLLRRSRSASIVTSLVNVLVLRVPAIRRSLVTLLVGTTSLVISSVARVRRIRPASVSHSVARAELNLFTREKLRGTTHSKSKKKKSERPLPFCPVDFCRSSSSHSSRLSLSSLASFSVLISEKTEPA